MVMLYRVGFCTETVDGEAKQSNTTCCGIGGHICHWFCRLTVWYVACQYARSTTF
jgi:hypothetical protein